MMSSMDPMRTLGMQEEATETSFLFASSLLASFAGKNYTNLRRARARTPSKGHGCYSSVLLLRASPLLFIDTKGLTKENT
jgi:hypothetical protein